MIFKTFFLLNSLNIILILPNFCLSQSPQTLSSIQIIFSNNGTHTKFTLTSNLGGTLTDSWMAVGLNKLNTASVGQMVCRFQFFFRCRTLCF